LPPIAPFSAAITLSPPLRRCFHFSFLLLAAASAAITFATFAAAYF
jgi:hypothetical protein